jgi:hypothetical protein
MEFGVRSMKMSASIAISRYSVSAMAAMLLLLLAGCTGDPNTQRIANLLSSYVTGRNEKVPREAAAAIPYATMGLEFGFTPQILLTLGTANAEEFYWYAGE